MTIGDEMLGRRALGRYRIVRALARGGMGVIYLGRVEGAAGFSKPVVVKTVIPQLTSDSKLAGMFVREAHILSNMQHPGIVGVLDFGKLDDAYVMVLEYVHGFHLGQWHRYVMMSGRTQEVDHAVYVAAHVLDALHYAHRLKRPDGTPLDIVHRDVSPSNILLDVRGQVKLHDFGIARMTEETNAYKTQGDATFKGTLPFAAPEALQGAPASPQSDVYSCAVVLYQLLAGRNPFKGQQPSETLHRVLTHTPQALSVLREDIPFEIEAAVVKALSKSPTDRFESAAEFADALRAGLSSSEDEVSTSFARAVLQDFNGNMAESLGLESLEVRDAAWREELLARPSGPPTAIPAKLDSTPPIAPAPTTGTPPAVQSDAPTDLGLPGKKGSAHIPIIAGALVLAAGAAAAFFAVSARQKPEPSPRFLVVEKENAEPSADSVTAAPPNAASATSVTQGTAATSEPAAADPTTTSPSSRTSNPTAPTPSGKPTAGGDAAQLSRAFQKQQGRVQGCFAQHAKDIEGQPRIAVRFSVDTSGKVQRAELIPASLAGTELGSCLAAAARATDFGPQSEPMTFSIPITARRSP